MASVLAKVAQDISPARLAAFRILRQVESGAFSSVLLASEEPQLQPSDRALCHELVLGVLRWQLRLDKIIEHFSKRSIENLDAGVRIALRLGLYQLRYLTRIPASAAVNESVSLVRAARLSSATTFANAVLRRAIREAEYDPVADVSDPIEKIALQTSHPVWLIDRWANSFGVDQAEAFARANNTVPPTAFRIVKTRANESKVLSRLSSSGAKLQSSDVAKGAWRVSGATSVVREASAEGEIYLQDEASQLVSLTVDVKPGERVLDLCGAPGGKTTQMAERAGDRALIIVGDRSATRMETVVATTRLHALKSVKPVLLDASGQLPFALGSFDKVLLDAPCSGTGTLRRNPEIRWRISPVDIAMLAKQQKKMLRRAIEMVKPGGRLVYSTCSVERDENEEVIEGLRLVETIRTWPHREGCDGFFIATLQKPDTDFR